MAASQRQGKHAELGLLPLPATVAFDSSNNVHHTAVTTSKFKRFLFNLRREVGRGHLPTDFSRATSSSTSVTSFSSPSRAPSPSSPSTPITFGSRRTETLESDHGRTHHAAINILSAQSSDQQQGIENEPVEAVVVDRPGEPSDAWFHQFSSTPPPVAPDETDATTEPRSSFAYARSNPNNLNPTNSNSGSPRGHQPLLDWRPLRATSAFVKSRLWNRVSSFFMPAFNDKTMEGNFNRERWYTQKTTFVAGAVFMLFTCLLQIGLTKGTSTFNRIGTFIIGPVMSFVLILAAMFNLPRRITWVWQILVFVPVWIGACGFLIDLSLCGYFDVIRGPECTGRDYLNGFYYATAYPVVGLFALGQGRFLHVVGVTLFLVVALVLIVPSNVNFLRDIFPWLVFQVFMVFFDYFREDSDRGTYTLRMEVKAQFRAKQRAQINERTTMDAKRKFFNYIFHEVRVPLNTAVLAIQNLKTALPEAFSSNSSHNLEFSALQSSLSMMSTVLNDVLDFDKMERGTFVSVNKAFSFHRMIESILGPLKLDTDARGLLLESDLDVSIDRAALSSPSPPPSSSIQYDHIKIGDGVFLGDETRIRQIINNLASNACKFTNSGGKVKIVTKLVFPTTSSPSSTGNTTISNNNSKNNNNTNSVSTPSSSFGFSVGSDLEKGSLDTPSPDHGSFPPNTATTKTTAVEEEAVEEKLEHSFNEQNDDCPSEKSESPTKGIIVRVEVYDTGVGVCKRDLQDGKMFSAYHQNYQTLQQGGKGTGLGLSLTKKIVAFSGGRLGVKSQAGKGSCFWFELPLGTTATVPSHDTGASPNGVDEDVKIVNEKADVPPPPPLGVSEDKTSLMEAPVTSPPAQSTTTSLTPATTAPASAPTAATGTTITNIRVLTVDDDLLTRKLMSRMLSRLHCNVESAENGAIALEMVLEAPPDNPFKFVFLDNQMPVMTGVQTVAKMKALGRKEVVIGVTANALFADQEEFMQAGASMVLTKPLKEADLRRVLEGLL